MVKFSVILAMTNYANMLYKTGVDSNQAEAKEYYKRAVELNSDIALNNYGIILISILMN